MVGTAGATVLILGCGLVTGLVAARSLGPGGRGELAAITVWVSMFLYAGTLGLPEATAYFAASHVPMRARVWVTGLIAALGLGLCITAAGWWIVPLLFGGREDGLTSSVRWYLALFAVPGCASLCTTAWLQGAGRLHTYNLSRTSIHVVNAAGMLALYVAGDRTVMHFAAVLLVGNFVGLLVSAVSGPWRIVHAVRPSTSLAGSMFHYGLRVQVGNWSSVASGRLDQMLLSLFAATAVLGLYVVAVTYASVLLTIPGSAAIVMLPEMIRRHAMGEAGACLERWYRRMLWATLLGGGIVAGGATMLIPFLFGVSYADAVPLALILVPATVLLGMNTLLGTAFRGIDRPEVGSAAELIGMVAAVAALAALLPPFGAYGAAVASLLAYAISQVYLLRQVPRAFHVDVRALVVLRREDVDALRAGITSVISQIAAATYDASRTREWSRR